MKKLLKIFIIIELTLLVVLNLFFHFYNLSKSEYKDGGEKVDFEKNSYDKTYKMVVLTEKYLNMDFINVTIIDNNTQKEVYSIKNEYRAFDFKWITWEEESNSFWVNSSDLGTYCYAYIDNNIWDKYSLRKKNDGYYLYKGNQLIENKNEVFKRKLPNKYKL